MARPAKKLRGDAVGVTEAAALLGVTRARVHQWITEGRLPAKHDFPVWRIKREDVEAFKALPRSPGSWKLKPVTPAQAAARAAWRGKMAKHEAMEAIVALRQLAEEEKAIEIYRQENPLARTPRGVKRKPRDTTRPRLEARKVKAYRPQ